MVQTEFFFIEIKKNSWNPKKKKISIQGALLDRVTQSNLDKNETFISKIFFVDYIAI